MPGCGYAGREVLFPQGHRDGLGLCLFEGRGLCVRGHHAGEGRLVAELRMAWPDDTAECQNVERGSFLFCACAT